mgnify:CR=1 FL=1
MSAYQNPYPTLIPKMLLRVVDAVTSNVVRLISVFVNAEQFITRVLTNFLVLAVVSPVVIVFIESQTGTLLLEQVFTTPATYFAGFFVSYFLAHRQFAPLRLSEETTTEEPDLGYPRLFIAILIGLLGNIISNHILSEPIYALVSIIGTLLVIKFYLKDTFVEDFESSDMDAYRLERWAPITVGVGYTYILLALFYSGRLLTIVGLTFISTSLLFYRFRTKRYKADYNYTLDDFYERKAVTEDEVVDRIQTLRSAGVIQKSTENVLEEYTEEAKNVTAGKMSLDEFAQAITSSTTDTVHLNQTQDTEDNRVVADVAEDELIQDIMWSWAECKDQIEKYGQDSFPQIEESTLRSCTKTNLQTFDKQLTGIEENLQENPNVSSQETVTIQRLQEKLDSLIDQF